MNGQGFINGEYSEPFQISNKVKKGCVLAPILFNLFFTQVLHMVIKNINSGIYIKYHLDGSVFDTRHLSAGTKTIEKLIEKALFADDCIP